MNKNLNIIITIYQLANQISNKQPNNKLFIKPIKQISFISNKKINRNKSMISESIYIDFTTSISGIPTDFKIFEFKTHLFIYINQDSHTNLFFQDKIYSFLKNKFIRGKYNYKKHKEFVVYCRLRGEQFLKAVEVILLEVLNEKNLR
ncbi:hypothetical protein DMUE_0842 [Dictyocoela muelleri]|nr:hypothetical protein DMUE_0842 [Dictyocoela muelleri]